MNKKIGRNDPCPCGSGKKSKRCCMQGRNKKQKDIRPQTQSPLSSFSWMEDDGFHCIMPGVAPSPDELERMTKEYQKQIRSSPMWDEMVRRFGKEKAEELLKQCRVKPR